MPSLAVILSTQTQLEHDGDHALGKQKRRKGKKRAQDYEGDEVFKVSRETICSTPAESNVLLAAVDGELFLSLL